MLKPKHPYRFKTKEEFIQKWGERWRRDNPVFFNEDMDYLLGTDFKHNISKEFLDGFRQISIPRQETHQNECWEIHIAHLIKNKNKIPSYMLSRKKEKKDSYMTNTINIKTKRLWNFY